MPIFDYRCNNCKTLYDVFHKGKEIIGDILCPSCGSNQYTKLMSVPSILSKGNTELPCNPNSCGMDMSRCGGVCGMN
jgi:putative FmdB family regulatory protein